MFFSNSSDNLLNAAWLADIMMKKRTYLIIYSNLLHYNSIIYSNLLYYNRTKLQPRYLADGKRGDFAFDLNRCLLLIMSEAQ